MKHFVTAVCESWCVNTLCLLVCVAEFQDNADSHYFWHFKSCSIVQRLRLFVSQDFPRWSWMCSSSCRSTCSEVITSDPSSLKGQTGSNLKPFNKLCFSDQPTLFCLHHSITENTERQSNVFWFVMISLKPWFDLSLLDITRSLRWSCSDAHNRFAWRL